MATIPKRLPTRSLQEWEANKPTAQRANAHLQRVIRCAPPAWRAAIARRFDDRAPVLDQALTAQDFCMQPPEWVKAWGLMQMVADFEDQYGFAAVWDLSDDEICTMAKKLAAEADELDALTISQGGDLADRVDSIRLLIRASGVTEDKPIVGLPAILRAQDAAWWRRRLRVHVARMLEGGAIGLGLVQKGAGG